LFQEINERVSDDGLPYRVQASITFGTKP
jgi:hypothetical protein